MSNKIEWRRGGGEQGGHLTSWHWRIYYRCPDGAQRLLAHTRIQARKHGAHVSEAPTFRDALAVVRQYGNLSEAYQ
jgi:hypothetical protein